MKKKNSEMNAFNTAMDTILHADPKAVKEAMKQEKQENAEKRKAKKSSASAPACRAKN